MSLDHPGTGSTETTESSETTETTPPPPLEPPDPSGEPAAGDGSGRGSLRTSRGTLAALIAIFVGLLIGAVGNIVHLPYAILQPGPASNVLGKDSQGTSDLIAISGEKTYAATGSLDFTTVRVNGGPGYPVNVWDLLSAKFAGDQEIYPVDVIFPPAQSAADVAATNTAEMVDSQQEAAAVALIKLGFTVTQRVKVGQIAAGAPSGDVLKVGDVITRVGTAPVTDATSVRAQIQKATPGGVLAIGVVRDGKPVSVEAKTGASGGRTVLGIVLAIDFQFPFSVKIDAGNVGGPSAGLMFSLGIYDKLTDGSLTGGANIAGTGTIDSTGTVGAIGGIRQKMAGARAAGATWFLAPADNCNEVVDHVPSGMQAVKVATFDDAEAAVAKIGQGQTSGLPRC
ncbi:S16 family serine protease [Lapillicoccus sp.]|uniref:YlbL family protein n=1 Tax=Lapillicoccus sp. TaxID=1909287 RepID=UPI0025E96C5F|nr:S16 family serine protease [Lapillicoccus sp.]